MFDSNGLRLLFKLLTCEFYWGSLAQTTVRTFFMILPREIIPQITSDEKLGSVPITGTNCFPSQASR
jgi:hypothetical protein